MTTTSTALKSQKTERTELLFTPPKMVPEPPTMPPSEPSEITPDNIAKAYKSALRKIKRDRRVVLSRAAVGRINLGKGEEGNVDLYISMFGARIDSEYKVLSEKQDSAARESFFKLMDFVDRSKLTKAAEKEYKRFLRNIGW